MAERGYLPDVNLWIALASNRHVHHLVARRWLDSTADPIFYCRITQMGLLRLLTNRRVMDEDVLMPPDALSVYKEFLSDARIHFSEEPEGVEKRWNALMTNPRVGGSSWTDAYLAAFAMEAAVRLVSLDAGTRKWAGLTPEVLVG